MNWNVLTKGIVYTIYISYEKKILSSTFRNNETTSTFLSSFYAITHRLRNNTFKKEFEKIPIRIYIYRYNINNVFKTIRYIHILLLLNFISPHNKNQLNQKTKTSYNNIIDPSSLIFINKIFLNILSYIKK